MNSDNSPTDLRSLWQCQTSESISMSAQELGQLSQKFARKISRRNLRETVAAAFVVFAFGYYFSEWHTVLLRLGSALTIAGVLLITFTIHRKGSVATMSAALDSATCLEFYRSELVRQRDLLRSIWTWYFLPLFPGTILFLSGALQQALLKPDARSHIGSIILHCSPFAVMFAATLILGARLNRKAAQRLQQQIDTLNAARIKT